MCTILFAWQQSPEQPLLVTANRDEFHQRPTAHAAWRNGVFSGIDLLAGGTWLGLHENGRFAAVTNFREFPLQHQAKSRGALPSDFLQGTQTPAEYCASIAAVQEEYGPFNLMVCDGESLWYMSNRGVAPCALEPGIYGMSNGLLNDPWPKVVRGREALANHLQASDNALLELLRDTHQPADEELPDTGVGVEFERRVAPLFIRSKEYGTRGSSIVRLNNKGEWTMVEQNWDPEGNPAEPMHTSYS